jgi:hypothetical protein
MDERGHQALLEAGGHFGGEFERRELWATD